MNPIFADFNAMTESGQVRLTCKGSQDDLRAADLHSGDWAWLSDGELIVGGRIDTSSGDRVVAVPDWRTLVHLDEPYEIAAVGQELTDLLKRENPSVEELWRGFQLLTIFERIAPATVARPGYFSFRRAVILLQLQRLELALIEIQAARRVARAIPTTTSSFWKSSGEPTFHRPCARPRSWQPIRTSTPRFSQSVFMSWRRMRIIWTTIFSRLLQKRSWGWSSGSSVHQAEIVFAPRISRSYSSTAD